MGWSLFGGKKKKQLPKATMPPPADDRVDAATVHAAIAEAKRELLVRNKAMGADKDPDAADRKRRLVTAALAVHRIKQPVLNELSGSDHERLKTMAEATLGVGAGGPKRK